MDRDELVEACVDARGEGPAAVAEVVERAVATAAPFGDEPYLELHRSDDLLVQQYLWPPGYATRAHDHGGLWAVVGIFRGAEENRLFRVADDRASFVRAREYGAGDVASLGPELVHAVRNPRSHEWTVALHVYGGDLARTPAPRSEWTEPDLVRRPFDAVDNVSCFFDAVRQAQG